MVIRDFDYTEASTVQEACKLLNQLGEEAKVISGGNALVLLMKQGVFRPKHLVSISGIPGLDEVSLDAQGNVHIGGLVTHRTVETSPLIKENLPVISQMAKQVANIRVRNTGTIGGNLCHADPHSDPPALLIALGARVRAVGLSGERVIPLDEFFLDYYETALEKDEILIQVVIPAPAPRTGFSYQRLTAPSETGKPCVNVAVALSLNGDANRCNEVRIAVGSVSPTPVKVSEAEQVLRGRLPDSASIEKAAEAAAKEASPTGDIYGSEWYKREMVKLLVRRGINEALTSARATAVVRG